MSHRNNDNNSSWNNRNSRNNNESGIGVGGGGTGYKNWSGNNRYNPDNRYNKDRRNYRGGYGGRNDRRSYDDRRGGKSYRGGQWSGNNGPIGPDGNYSSHPRHHNNRHPKNLDKNTKYGPAGEAQGNSRPMIHDVQIQQIAPSTVDFSDSADSTADLGDGGGQERMPNVDKPMDTIDSGVGEYASPLEEFSGFPDTEPSDTANGDTVVSNDDLTARQILPTEDDKVEVIPQENELIKLIEDEALKMITDAEQPSCSTSTQNNNPENNVASTNEPCSNQNPERRMTIERSAEQVTRKLINQLTTMNKYSLKQMINNPDSKYETALKTHARQKLRAEVRRQLRNFSLNDTTAQVKTNCGMLEPDECVDSDKIPDALLEQIGKVLDLNLLDLNVPEEQAPPTNTSVDEDDCAINQQDADFSATEVLDKNLRLTDDDDVQLHLDAEDIFARAELLLMKGSESIRKGNSSGPSSPTEEMFPNDQIDSIVSEENGFDKVLELNRNDSAKETDLLEETIGSAFPCFLRVSTVEELNKKVDDLSSMIVINNQDECINSTMEVLEPPSMEIENTCVPPSIEIEDTCVPPSIEIEDTCVSDLGDTFIQEIPKISDDSPEQTSAPEISENIIENAAENVPKEQGNENTERTLIEDTQTDVIGRCDEPLPSVQNTETTQTVNKNPEETPIEIVCSTRKPETSTGTIRAPTHPELATRKSKSSKAYKPNLVMHEHNKRDTKSTSSSPSRSPSLSSNSSTTAKSHRLGPSPAALKQTACPPKHHNTNSSNSSSNSSNNVTIVNNSNNHNRERSQRKRDCNVKETSIGSNNANSVTLSAMQANSNISTSDSPSKTSNKVSSLPKETVRLSPAKETSPPEIPAVRMHQPRAKTPGPRPFDESQSTSSSGKKKKKKKRNRRKDHSPDGGMMLECDLRISRPVVTPTPPPTQHRDVNPSNSKRSYEFEREPKPARETRAKSVDPRLCYDSKRDKEKERSRDKSRAREMDDKRDIEKETRKEKSKDDRREAEKEKNKDDRREAEKEKEIKKEKENDRAKEREEKKEKETLGSNAETTKNSSQQAELSLPRADRERKKSPAPKLVPKAVTDSSKESSKELPLNDVAKEQENLPTKKSPAPKLMPKAATDSSKESSKELPLNDVAKEQENLPTKEVPKESLKEKEPVKVLEDKEATIIPRKEENRDVPSVQEAQVLKNEETRDFPKEKEIRSSARDKCTKDVMTRKESKDPPRDKEALTDSKEREPKIVAKGKEIKEKEATESTPEIDVEKSQKRKKSLLRGPNLIKGRKEVVNQEATISEEPPAQRSRKETVPQEVQPVQLSVTKLRKEVFPVETVPPIQPVPQRKETTTVSTQSAIPDHSAVLLSATASFISRTASPRPWKSPGEKKLLPGVPLLPAPTQPTCPLSPSSEGHRTPTHPSPVTSPEPQYVQHVPLSIASQPDVLQRIALPSTLAPLAAPQASAFAPVMALLNQMQEIDNKMSDFQRRKMQIDSEMMKLNSEKFQIDQSSMQLQSDRFMVLNALRAALVDCELSTIAAVQSVPRISSVNSAIVTRRRPQEPNPEAAPKSKRRKEAEPILKCPPPVRQVNAATSTPELSEPEEPPTPTSTTGTGGERTIRRITKISDNTQILKLFQRRRLISEKSAEESQSEDSAGPAAASKPIAKRRRTRTTTAEQNDVPVLTVGGRLRSNSSRSIEVRNSVESAPQSVPLDQTAHTATNIPSTALSPNFPSTTSSRVIKKDEEVPLVGHRNLLTREVKIVLNKLNVADRNNT